MADFAPLTAQIAEFVAGVVAHGAPADAAPWVRIGFTDCAAVTLAGRREPATQILWRAARRQGGIGESRVAHGAERQTSEAAALIGATAAHALDWDDYAFSNHPSAVLVPAILAVSETVAADGAAMMAAYVAGYECWAALMAREPDHLNAKGWHPTGVFGPIASAAAAAVLLRLDRDRARHAIGLAASFGGGLMSNFGTMTKPLHGGRAAQSGIVAAKLAADGFGAGAAALEADLGLLRALSPANRVDRTTPFDRLGKDWAILRLGLNVKKYPTVGASQRSIDAVIALRKRIRLDPAELRSITVRVGARHATVTPFHRPATALEAKFSLEFAVSAALLRGKVGLAEVDDAFVCSPELRRLVELVRIETTEEIDPGYPGAAPFDQVRITMNDGTEHLSDQVRRATGHADMPLSTDELWTKFADCAVGAGEKEAEAQRLFEAMQRIDRLASADQIPSLG
jgi:aconitate decarboxylase